jgi:HEPN domain-containing protein
MKKDEELNKWMRFAESAFELAKRGRVSKKITYEDLCFQAQQAAEKSIKAVLIFYNIPFPKTHKIEYLLQLL